MNPSETRSTPAGDADSPARPRPSRRRSTASQQWATARRRIGTMLLVVAIVVAGGAGLPGVTTAVVDPVSAQPAVDDRTKPTADAGTNRTSITRSPVSFDASGSSDDTLVFAYKWDFDGDGQTDAYGETARHRFETPGTYTVTLTVVDPAGNADTDTVVVTVADPVGPTARAGPNLTVEAGTPVTLNGSGSTDDVGVTYYVWEFDGDGIADATGRTTEHVFREPGRHRVALVVSDGAGNLDTDTLTVRVTDTQAPSARIDADTSAEVGAAVTFDGSNTTDNGVVATYAWDVDGDGIADATGPTIEHAFDAPGDYTVVLQTTDGGGNSDVARVTVTVEDTTTPSHASPPPISTMVPTP